MRNLNILTKYQGTVPDVAPDDTVTTICLDEFGQTMFVYTLHHCLFAYKMSNLCEL